MRYEYEDLRVVTLIPPKRKFCLGEKKEVLRKAKHKNRRFFKVHVPSKM